MKNEGPKTKNQGKTAKGAKSQFLADPWSRVKGTNPKGQGPWAKDQEQRTKSK
jgi:hypothetical protein